MDDGARNLALELLATYAGNLRGPLAATELARLRAAGIDRIQFAWGARSRRATPTTGACTGRSA